MNNISSIEFNTFLGEILKETFPNTELFIVAGGDYLKDVIMELRQDNAKYRYSPWKLYKQNSNYEDTVEELVETWRRIINKHTIK